MRAVTAIAGVAIMGTTALGVSACSQVEPKVAFAKAYSSTMNQKDMASTFSLKTTSADVKKLMTALDTGDSTSPSAKAGLDAVANVLPKLTITSKMHSNGGDISSETDQTKLDQAATIAVDGAGIDVVRLGKEMYFKADVDGIGSKTGLFTGTQVKMMMTDLPAEMSWLNDVVDGKWIGLPESATTQLLQGKDASAANDPKKMKEIRDKIQASVEKNATFEKVGDDRIDVKVKVKPFLKDMQEVAKDVNTASPSANPTSDLKNVKEDAIMTVKTTVKDERLTQAEVDIPQMWSWFDESTMDAKDKESFTKAKNSGFNGSMLMTMTNQGVSITKPSGAKMLTDEQVKNLTRSIGGSSGSSAL